MTDLDQKVRETRAGDIVVRRRHGKWMADVIGDTAHSGGWSDPVSAVRAVKKDASRILDLIQTEKGQAMTDWQPINTAPRDGTWIIIEGEMNGGDTSSALVARWNPIIDNGSEYEWQALDARPYDDTIATDDDLWNWYSEGRVSQWMPLP